MQQMHNHRQIYGTIREEFETCVCRISKSLIHGISMLAENFALKCQFAHSTVRKCVQFIHAKLEFI